MMRRFTRRRRGGARPGGDTPIDAAALLQQILQQEIVPADSLEPLVAEEVPASFAALGTGTNRNGDRLLVALSPRHANHALLAALAVAGRLAETDSFTGEVYVIAPEWTSAGRRLLSIAADRPYRLIAVAAPGLGPDGARVSAEASTAGAVLTPAQIAGHLARPADRDLFLRAARGLEGLAAKHGGALRGFGRSVEVVLMARRVAELRAEDGNVALTTILPQRSTAKLSPESLSGALDGLEGQLRKRLNDRRVRDGEEGLRARAIGAFRTWHSLRALVPWPLGGRDSEVIDWVGVDVEGRPVIGAARQSLDLSALAEIVDGMLALQTPLPSVLAQAAPPVVLDSPRLVVGGSEVAPGVGRALEALALTHELFEMREGRSGELELRSLAAGEAPTRAPSSRRRSNERQRRPANDRTDEAEAAPEEAAVEASESAEAEAEERPSGERGRGRGRRSRGGRGRSRRDGGGRDREASSGSDDAGGEDRAAPRFEEVSLFELDDEPERESSGSRGARRRGRGRGRRPRGGAGDEARQGSEDGPAVDADAPAGEPRGSAPAESEGGPEEAPDDDAFLIDEEGPELEEVPDFEAAPPPSYDDDEEIAEEAETQPSAPQRAVEVVADAPRLPRRRGAIVAHADPDSIIAAVLIARDVRMIEGLWVYPQSELMNFFRGVTTDLREDTPIYVVGFTPSPAVEVVQAASLYRDRIMWFDHRDWPPEDLQAMRDAIGEDSVNVVAGCGSSLPPVLECCSRRSRFTDKLVDLVAGRFTEHDFERWGRLWWWRLGEIAKKTGDRRADVEPLLSGRPSDLAREAAGAETPPLPAEVDFVSRRDFRLVHFAGYALVVLEVPEELDLHLTARVARERYAAPLSLALRPESEIAVFAGDELAGRRSLDLTALVNHVADKLEWVEKLPDNDHVARMRVHDLAANPERLDDIVAEIAMGRSILER
jgi:hypothetical protein